MPHKIPLPDESTHESQPSIIEHTRQVVDRYHNWSEAHPLAATAAETIALFAIKKVIRYAGDKAGVNLGNGHSEKLLNHAADHPVRAAINTVVVAPITEEFKYRIAAPHVTRKALGVDADTRASTIIDHAGALGFAATHVGDPRTPEGRRNLAFPIGPFIGGEHYRSLLKRRGPGYAIAAHMIHNTLAGVEAIPEILKRRRSKEP